jgi:hypothetical protein
LRGTSTNGFPKVTRHIINEPCKTLYYCSAATAGAGSSMWKTLLQLLLLFVLCCSAWSAPACSSAALQQLIVSSRAQALALAIYTSCEGGNFEVKWLGVVELSNVIAVGANTTLNIVGADQQATVSGGNATSLFQVAANGSLHLQELTLSDGFVNDSISTGGAITLQSHASLTVVACTFERNVAVFGGSIYIADKDFTASDATLSAGLVTLQNSSFSNCAAAESGGVVWLGNARQLITSGSVFEQNRCTWGGGKRRRQLLCVYSICHARTASHAALMHYNTTFLNCCLLLLVQVSSTRTQPRS